MSLFISAALGTNGIVNTASSGTVTSVNFGQAYNVTKPMVSSSAVGATDTTSGGIRRTATGLLKIYDATAGLPANTTIRQGVAFTATGQACVNIAAIDLDDLYFVSGMAVTSDGRIYVAVAAGVTAPVAAFSADDTTPYVDDTVTFTDASTNTPTSWLWDFGDGGASTLQSPTHVYEDVGTYTVSLTARNAAGYDVETKVGYITVEEAPSYTGPLDLVPGAVVAYDQFAASTSAIGTPLYTLERESDNSAESFDSEASGASPVSEITTFVGNKVMVACELDSGGSGYGNEQTFVVTVVGGTGSAATANVTSDADGVVTTINSFTKGSYSVAPSSSVATTGGSGTGLSLDSTFENNHGTLLNDQSGSAVSLLGANRPVWTPNISGDVPAFIAGDFEATGQFISLPNGAVTLFAVIRDSGNIFLTGAGDDYYTFTLSADSAGQQADIRMRNDGSTLRRAFFQAPEGFEGVLAIHEMVGNGNNWDYKINGVSATLLDHDDGVVTALTATSVAIAVSVIDASTPALGAVYVWPTILSNGDRTALREKFAANYDLTLP